MPYYVLIREPGAGWDPTLAMREQERWDDHAAFMDSLAEEGFIVLGGPLGDGESRFMHVVEADNPKAIEARLAEDPWTPTGMLRTASVEPWQILLDSRSAPPT